MAQSNPAQRAAGARRVRERRAHALANLRDTSATANGVLQDVPEGLETASVYIVLTHCPSIGAKKAERALQCAGVWPFRHMNQLTAHERSAILRELPDQGDT